MGLTKLQTVVLLLLVSFSPLCCMSLSPALPSMARHLRIFASDAQLLITLFLVGFTVGQLFYGPLSNRFGRKLFITLGIVLSIVCTQVSLFAASKQLFSLLIVTRIVWGLAGGACLKMSYNIAADLLTGKRLTTMISLFVLSFAIVPPLSVAVSGFLTQLLSWHSVFLYLFVYSCILLYLSLLLPETVADKDFSALQLKRITSTFIQILSSQKLVLSALIMGVGSTVTYLIATIVPFISIEVLSMKPGTYGLLALLANSGMLAAGLLSIHLAKTRSPLSTILLGSVLFLLGSLTYLIPFYLGFINTLTLFLPMPLLFLGSNLSFTNASSIGLSTAYDKSYASSMMTFINLTFTITLLYIACKYPFTNTYLLPTLLTLLAMLTLSLWFRLKRLSLRE